MHYEFSSPYPSIATDPIDIATIMTGIAEILTKIIVIK
jgi:hypothetical protein